MSDVEDRVDDVSEGGDDLFGDDDGDDASQIEDNAPIPSDNDSDNDRRRSASPDSQSQRGRSQRELTAEGQEQIVNISTGTIFRHGLPKTDGNVSGYLQPLLQLNPAIVLNCLQMQLVKVPNFLRIIPEPWHDDSTLSDWTIQNSLRQIPANIIRYRENPETGKLESNANIYKWSDGSTTLQVGEEHYEIQVKPQIPPAKKAYMPDRDANRYIAAAQEGMGQLLTVAHVSEEWSIRPDKKRVMEETEQLRERMTKATGGAKEGELIITTTIDPERAKREAEIAEKDRLRAQRKRENAQLRVEAGPGGFRKGGGGSMGLGEIDGGRRATGRKRGPGGAAKRSRGRKNNDYSDEEEDDEGYDKEDEFLANSDEEISEGEDDNILDDGDVEFEREKPRAKKRQKRDEASEDEGDTDADGEPDDDAPAATGDHGRRRVRRVVSDDDEEDDE